MRVVHPRYALRPLGGAEKQPARLEWAAGVTCDCMGKYPLLVHSLPWLCACHPASRHVPRVTQPCVSALLRSLLHRVGESNGIRFPREFALLIKQLLYFDRYNRILAPQLRVYDDQRINLRKV